MNDFPSYIESRLRRPAAVGTCTVVDSTPVLSFGPASQARFATLGLNPSDKEFYGEDGNELVGNRRRLATLNSLGVSDLSAAPTSVLKQVVADCDNYFSRNPYRRWFDRLDYVLRGFAASYYNSSACHLDLVQWATSPKWSDLGRELRKQLIKSDAAFLAEQLRCEHLNVLLVNGKSVFRELERAFNLEAAVEPSVEVGTLNCKLWTARIERVLVIGWSTNLQSSFGVSNKFLLSLRERVAGLVQTRSL